MTQEEKQQAHAILSKSFDEIKLLQLRMIDPRLSEYICGLINNPDLHNGYEILGAVKFLRLLRTYDFDAAKVRQIIHLREGDWVRDERGRMHHKSGGIKCPGTDIAHVYRWQPFQVFVLASVFGFYNWFNTEVPADIKPVLADTEREENTQVTILMMPMLLND